MLVLERQKMYSFTFERMTVNRLNEDSLKKQILSIARVCKRNQQNEWDFKIPRNMRTEVAINNGDLRWRYTFVIKISKPGSRKASTLEKQLERITVRLEAAAKKQKWKKVADEALVADGLNSYQVLNNAGEMVGDTAPAFQVKVEEVQKPSRWFLGCDLPELNDAVLNTYFHRLYDREAHIRILYDQLKVAVKTGFKTRHHMLLKGDPGCAKSELFKCFIAWLGGDLFEEVDASTMTKAGLELLLMNRAKSGTLKPILVMEEIEKCHDANVACLIQVMDARGKIQRVNANTVKGEETAYKCEIVLWGTCNNEETLQKFHDGAIWSRFSTKLDCERPDEVLMRKILKREIGDIDGKEEWIEPVITFCYNELQDNPQFKRDFNDPRFARAMLAGGDRLLDGSYFRDIRHTSKSLRIQVDNLKKEDIKAEEKPVSSEESNVSSAPIS